MPASETRILLEHIGEPQSCTLEGYRRRGGYEALRKALFEMTPDDVIEEVKTSGVRGRGGAGFPAGVKWGFIPKASPKARYLVCNADESEPGTAKDRAIMEFDPHQLIEGCIICSYAIGAHYAFIYIRGEYHHIAEHLQFAINQAYEAGLAGKGILGSEYDCEVILYRGGGAYICGEESGLLTSLEGRKGYPRNKPPFPAIEGLYKSPTVVNNVETLACVPLVISKGGEWYASMGTEKSKGTKLLSISGHVNKPGVYEIELGKMTLREIIDDLAGGVPGGRKIKGVIPGGSSMPILPPDKLDIPFDYESVQAAGSLLGSGGIIVLDETVDIVEMALLLTKFYAHESCGQCTPCREGTRWMLNTMTAIYEKQGHPDDLDLIRGLFKTEFSSICLLWSSLIMPIRAFLQHYPEEFEAYIKQSKLDLEAIKNKEQLSPSTALAVPGEALPGRPVKLRLAE